MNEIDEIRRKIERGEYLNARKDDWGGAGVIITANPDRAHRPGDIVVCTLYAKFIIWLLEELKPIIRVDHISKYDYYETFARIASDAAEKSGDDIPALLNYILDNICPL